jgi:hypothetical protein
LNIPQALRPDGATQKLPRWDRWCVGFDYLILGYINRFVNPKTMDLPTSPF